MSSQPNVTDEEAGQHESEQPDTDNAYTLTTTARIDETITTNDYEAMSAYDHNTTIAEQSDLTTQFPQHLFNGDETEIQEIDGEAIDDTFPTVATAVAMNLEERDEDDSGDNYNYNYNYNNNDDDDGGGGGGEGEDEQEYDAEPKYGHGIRHNAQTNETGGGGHSPDHSNRSSSNDMSDSINSYELRAV